MLAQTFTIHTPNNKPITLGLNGSNMTNLLYLVSEMLVDGNIDEITVMEWHHGG